MDLASWADGGEAEYAAAIKASITGVSVTVFPDNVRAGSGEWPCLLAPNRAPSHH